MFLFCFSQQDGIVQQHCSQRGPIVRVQALGRGDRRPERHLLARVITLPVLKQADIVQERHPIVFEYLRAHGENCLRAFERVPRFAKLHLFRIQQAKVIRDFKAHMAVAEACLLPDTEDGDIFLFRVNLASLGLEQSRLHRADERLFLGQCYAQRL